MSLHWIGALLISQAFVAASAIAADPQKAPEGTCLAPGQWGIPSQSALRTVGASEVLAAGRDAQFVLLGESHDNADHHRWQLHTLAMLLAERGRLVIGLEMFPRRTQAVLDRWVAGNLTEAELLRQTDWSRVWGYDAELYLPLLHFARLHRIPLAALNVERSLVREVGEKGWAAIPAERREGLTEPAPATDSYRAVLRESYEQHPRESPGDAAAFERFVEAQSVWDRAFAEALATAAKRVPAALIVGIIGTGHLRDGHGVPYQLQKLGAKRVKVWLPQSAKTPCGQFRAGLADAVFAVGDFVAANPPRLGIFLEEAEEGPRVREVVAGSVAEGAGVKQGDRVVTAAGIRIASASELIATVKRQAPGTWLPLTVERSGREVELVAKFPAAAVQ